MHITSDLICRAKGNVYEKLYFEGLGDDDSISIIIDRSLADAPLPCRLFPWRDSKSSLPSYIAVTPILPVESGAYCIGRFDGSGSLLEAQIRTVDYKKAKWKSRINYRTHRRACESIRCIDENDSNALNESIILKDVIRCDDSLLIRLETTVREGQEQNIHPSLLCIDDRLEILADSLVLMGREPIPSGIPGQPGKIRITYSFRVPCAIKPIHAYITFDDKHPNDYRQLDITCEMLNQKLAYSDDLLYLSAASDPYHEEWLKLHRPSNDDLELQRSTQLSKQPKFSIVVPLYMTPALLFTEMLDSVLAQTYSNWELILVNASPDDEELTRLVEEACTRDERVKSVTLEENRGISLNTNAGAALATGDFVCFLDHDDTIEPNLFFEYALAVNEHDDIDLVYCDEDKLLPDGTHLTPFFKPDFSLDYLRSINYICHLLAIRRTLFETLPPNTPDLDGAQDYNLVLQCAERGRRLHHVPKVLYHWRVTENSTSNKIEAKSYAVQAGERVLRNHLARMGISATVAAREDSATYRVTYDLPSPDPLVSIIIPNKDQVPLLDTCIRSIFERSTYDNYEVIVVENNSVRPETFSFYEELKQHYGARLHVIRWEHEFNFSKIINFGASHARGDYYVLLNNDTKIITENWLELLLGNCARNEVGAVGVRLYYPDDTIQHAGVCIAAGDADHLFAGLPRTSNADYFQLAHLQRNLSAVTAACMMVRRTAFESVGGFSEDLAVSFNDVDFCLKLRSADYLVVYNPDVELYHYESVSRGRDGDPAGKIRSLREVSLLRYRWADIFANGDPYFTPNITRAFPHGLHYKY